MKAIINITILLTTITLMTALNSCCKYQGSTTLELQFENFDFSKMDSVLLIETKKDDINHHQDTTFYNLTDNHIIKIRVFDNDAENSNFIIKHTSPDFEHFITEINSERTKSFGCAGGRIKFGFKLNGIEYKKEKTHSVTILK